ncbi:MAG: hypothetical protein ACYTFM_12690 [Planctomycetota bacterium]|jgi:hypothetical protein
MKRYVAIVKIGNHPNGSANCIKYKCNDLIGFVSYLDKRWPMWRWFNVYTNFGKFRGKQIACFTNNNRPEKKTI